MAIVARPAAASAEGELSVGWVIRFVRVADTLFDFAQGRLVRRL